MGSKRSRNKPKRSRKAQGQQQARPAHKKANSDRVSADARYSMRWQIALAAASILFGGFSIQSRCSFNQARREVSGNYYMDAQAADYFRDKIADIEEYADLDKTKTTPIEVVTAELKTMRLTLRPNGTATLSWFDSSCSLHFKATTEKIELIFDDYQDSMTKMMTGARKRYPTLTANQIRFPSQEFLVLKRTPNPNMLLFPLLHEHITDEGAVEKEVIYDNRLFLSRQ